MCFLARHFASEVSAISVAYEDVSASLRIQPSDLIAVRLMTGKLNRQTWSATTVEKCRSILLGVSIKKKKQRLSNAIVQHAAKQQHLQTLAKNGITPMAKTFLSIAFIVAGKGIAGTTKSGNIKRVSLINTPCRKTPDTMGMETVHDRKFSLWRYHSIRLKDSR